MTPLERVFRTLDHKEPDRVPLFLFLSLQGARETGTPLEEYFGKVDLVSEGQIRLLRKYGHDCYTTFHYDALEYEAFGGQVVYASDGPAHEGEPVIKEIDDIYSLEPPRVADSPGMLRVLEVTRRLRNAAAGNVPVIGAVMSPFSLPVMQLGLEKYLGVLADDRSALDRLMRVNEAFCAEWANAQLSAGATAIIYFDPVSSSPTITREQYRETGWPVARRMIKSAIKGPVLTHFISGNAIPSVDLVMTTGTLALGGSCNEDLRELKRITTGKLTLIGNLNDNAMQTWSPTDVRREVQSAILAGGSGGGFILSDSKGCIPLQVPDEVIMNIAKAAREYGRYPLK